MVQIVAKQTTAKILGRHSRLAVPFSWTMGTPAVLVDLEAGGYTAQVWVTGVTGVTAGPFSATVSGTVATYQLSVDDLAAASPDTTPAGKVQVVAVAENGTTTLVSDSRDITVGDWGGADDYTP